MKRQEQDCRKLASGKGWPISAVFVDDDVSACQAGDIDALVVYDLDRLHRHPLEFEQLFVIADAAGLPSPDHATPDA